MQKEILIEETLTESRKEDSKWYISGIYLQADVKNRNGRLYPKPVLSESVSKYNDKYILNNMALGETNHPKDRIKVDPDLASIKIIELKEDNNNYLGKALVLGTTRGKNLQALLEDDVKLGVSSRALGSLRESDGVKIVQNDLELYAIDVVSDPSAPDAYVSAVMEERYDWLYCDDEKCYMLMEEAKCKMNNIKNKEEREQLIIENWNRYLSALKESGNL